MPVSPETAAREILEIIPLVMRTLHLELRQPLALPNPVHFRVLLWLTEKAHNLSELAEKHGVTPPTMSNTISTLADRGLVRRTQSQQDRRKVVIELTDLGRSQLRQVQAQAETHIAAVLTPLSAREREDLMTGLAVLRSAFSLSGKA